MVTTLAATKKAFIRSVRPRPVQHEYRIQMYTGRRETHRASNDHPVVATKAAAEGDPRVDPEGQDGEHEPGQGARQGRQGDLTVSGGAVSARRPWGRRRSQEWRHLYCQWDWKERNAR